MVMTFRKRARGSPVEGAPHATLHGKYRGQSGGGGKWWEMWAKGALLWFLWGEMGKQM